jgi:hypothetical protein
MAKLHDPTSWKPNQLAIALISIEENIAFSTAKRKLASIENVKSKRD